MKYLNTSRKYYSLRGLNLETGEYYTTIKNQTIQQNSFFTFAAPKIVIYSSTGTGSQAYLRFNSKIYLSTELGGITMIAGGEEMMEGTWLNLTVNGTVATADPTTNPWIVDDANIAFNSGYNTVSGTFVLSSGTEVFDITGVWANSWENS